MRILLACAYYSPAHEFGGTVDVSIALAEGLADRGHKVRVITSSMVGHRRWLSWRATSRVLNGVEIKYLGCLAAPNNRPILPGVVSWAWSQTKGVDAIHIVGLYDMIGPAVAVCASLRGIPYSIEPSGHLRIADRSIAIKQIYFNTIGRRVCAGANAVVVTSDAEKRAAIQIGCDPSSMVQRNNGIDIGRYRTLPAKGIFRRELGLSDQPLVLWLGRITEVKNLEALIQSIAESPIPDIHLAVVGPAHEEAYLNTLRRLASRLGCANRVHFSVPRFGERKLQAFVDSDCLALVSHAENWGNVVSEALACGVPVLVSETCGASVLVGPGTGVVTSPETARIKRELAEVIGGGTRWSRRAAPEPASVTSLGWDGPVSTMEALFDSWR